MLTGNVKTVCWKKNKQQTNSNIVTLNSLSTLNNSYKSLNTITQNVQIFEDDQSIIDWLCTYDEKNSIAVQKEFKGTYKYDYNILNIHNSIMFNFNILYNEKVMEYNTKINLLKLHDNNNELEKTINEMQTFLQELEKNKYLESSLTYLLAYKKMGPILKKISLKKLTQEEESESNEERHQIIFEYIQIAKKYIVVDLIRIIDTSNFCKNCNTLIENYESCTDGDVCENCGFEFNSILKINISSGDIKNVYKGLNSDDANFEKAMVRFEGKQLNKLPKDIFATLDNHFTSYGLYNSEEVKTWQYSEEHGHRFKINEKNEKVILNREIMEEALKKCGYSDFYNDILLILHLYWCFPLPDLSEVKEIVRTYYVRTRKAFEVIEKERTSSLNNDFWLFKLLELTSFKCRRYYFKIIKTKQIRDDYEVIWKKMCELSNLEYKTTNW